MPTRQPRTTLRAARTARGWSQADAARALAALARGRGVPVAAAASLKTQLSRWENGHAAPEAPYRVLLAELFARSAADLGLEPPPQADVGGPAAGPAERLRARLAAAEAVDRQVLALWRSQLTAALGLDDRLGAGASGTVHALVEQLEAVLPHLPDPPRRRAVAALLARAATLAGAQALDAGDPDTAFARHARAAEAAAAAEAPALAVAAAAGQAAALVDVGAPLAAVAVLEHAVDDPPDPAVRARLRAALAAARAAAGDRAGARRALEAAAKALQRSGPGVPDVAHPPPGLPIELEPPGAAELHRWRGHTLAALDDPEAVTHLRRALAAEPSSARRRAELHAELARVLARAGRADEAAGHAAAARALAARVGSRRIPRLLDDQASRASPAGAPSVPSSASAAR